MQTIGLVFNVGFILALLAAAVPVPSSLAGDNTGPPPLPALTAPAAIEPDILATARARYREGRFDEVIELLAASAVADPTDLDINLLYGKALLGKCDQLKVYQDDYYQELVHRPYEIGMRLYRKNPYRPEPYYLVAKSLLINNRAVKARRNIEKAIHYASSGHADYAAYMEVLGDCRAEEAGSDRRKLKEAAGAYKAALAKGCDEPGFKDRVRKKMEHIKVRAGNAKPVKRKKRRVWD